VQIKARFCPGGYLRDLANGFNEHGYSLSGNAVTVEVSGELVSADGLTPSDAIRKLAWILEERGYTEPGFPRFRLDPDRSRTGPRTSIAAVDFVRPRRVIDAVHNSGGRRT
jgi:hypothetical protein